MDNLKIAAEALLSHCDDVSEKEILKEWAKLSLSEEDSVTKVNLALKFGMMWRKETEGPGKKVRKLVWIVCADYDVSREALSKELLDVIANTEHSP